MSRSPLIRSAALLCTLALLLVVTGADGALVRVNGIVLHADGGFHPQSLPRRQFAPIDFHGYFDIAAQGGGQPVALKQVEIDFDRDGRLTTAGLPVCPAERVASAGTAEARRVCGGAIVGDGRVEAAIGLLGGSLRVSSPLTIFNGPPEEGHPTVVLHAQASVLATQTFAVVAPVERRPGPFRYRTTIDVPTIAAGLGAITHVSARIARRFSSGGQRRSYVSAHCSDGILQTKGHFTFADGTVVDGAVEKFCAVR
jgi:hypothetical protein